MVWSYTKNKNGFQLLYDKDNHGEDEILTGFNINLPFKQETRDYIIEWTEERVKDMVDGLNNGTITCDLSPLDVNGIGFKMNIPQEVNLKINKRIEE